MSQEFTFNPLLTQLQRRSSLWVPHCGASPAPSASALGTRPAGRPGALGSDACDACRASGPVAGAPHGAAPRLTTTVCVRRPDTGFSSPGRTADLAPVLQQPERGHTPAGASEILVPQSKGLARPAPRTPSLCRRGRARGPLAGGADRRLTAIATHLAPFLRRLTTTASRRSTAAFHVLLLRGSRMCRPQTCPSGIKNQFELMIVDKQDTRSSDTSHALAEETYIRKGRLRSQEKGSSKPRETC